MTEHEKALAGLEYDYLDPELSAHKQRAMQLCQKLNHMDVSDAAARELVNRLTEKTGGAAALFLGSEEGGWRYIIGSRTLDLRALSREINAGISGRGGGRSEMIQGSAAAAKNEIAAFFQSWRV